MNTQEKIKTTVQALLATMFLWTLAAFLPGKVAAGPIMLGCLLFVAAVADWILE